MDGTLGKRDTGPRNPDGTWMAGVERGPYKPFPFPVGTRFGELTVAAWRHRRDRRTGRPMGWDPTCRCSCGWEGPVARHNLKNGRSTRCNACAKLSATAKRYWKYSAAMPEDAHRSRLLGRLDACIDRCHNAASAQFHHYGGRGLFVADEWREDRAAFLRHVRNLPGWDDPQLQMDRIDNDGGYFPGNVRFISRSGNMLNRRRVADLQERIRRLEAENADLRSRLGGA